MLSRAPHRKVRGNTLVEFALGWTLLWGLFSGTYQFGYAMFLFDTLETAVASGAAFAARTDFLSLNTAAYTNQVKNMVVYGSASGGARPVVPNLTTSNVSVTWKTDAKGVPLNVTVRIVNYQITTLFKNFLLINKPACTMRYSGIFIS